MNYLLHLLVLLGVYTIVALSLNLVLGYCGLLSLAHAGYFAVGAYSYALAATKWGWGFFPSVAVGVCLAMLLSLLLSLPSWRFRGDFFVLISIAVQALLFSVLHNWVTLDAQPGTWPNLTNGPFGLAGIPRPVIFGFHLEGQNAMALFACSMAFICALFFKRLFSSPWGRLLKAMRDDELALRGLGKNVRSAKMQAVAISCGMVAVAGSIYAGYLTYIDPSTASLEECILMACMVLVGGTGNFRGPIVGAALLLVIPEVLRFAQFPNSVAADLRLMIYGMLIILLVRFRPQGIAGEYRFE